MESVVEQLRNISNHLSRDWFDWLSLFIALLSTGAAAIAAIFSYKGIREMKNARYDEFRPILKWGGSQSNNDDVVLTFNFENVGKGPAYLITVFDKKDRQLAVELVNSMLKQDEENWVTIKSNEVFQSIYDDGGLVLKYKDVYGRRFSTFVDIKISKIGESWIKSVDQEFRQIIHN